MIKQEVVVPPNHLLFNFYLDQAPSKRPRRKLRLPNQISSPANIQRTNPSSNTRVTLKYIAPDTCPRTRNITGTANRPPTWLASWKPSARVDMITITPNPSPGKAGTTQKIITSHMVFGKKMCCI